MSSDWMGIVWLFVLLAGNAFFVGAEFAIIAAKRSQIEPRAQAGSKAAKTTLYAMEHVSRMLAICQLGITVCSLLILNVAEPSIKYLLEGPLEWMGLSPAFVSTVAFIIALIVVTYLHVVLGEMIPKNISLAVSDRAAMLLAPPLVLLARILAFVIVPLNGAANGLLRMIGVEPRDDVNAAYTVEEVQSIVAESKREGKLEDSTGLLSGALEFSDKTVGEVMVPHDQVVTVPVDATPEQIERLVGQTGFSRYILRDDEGDFLGYVHLKDLLYADEQADYTAPLQEKRRRSMVTIDEGDEIEDALAEMQRQGNHLGRVMTREGELVGVLFLEDIIEELVGEVHDAMQRDR